MFTFSFNMHSLFKRPNVQLKFTTIEIRLQLHFHPAATHFKKNEFFVLLVKKLFDHVYELKLS